MCSEVDKFELGVGNKIQNQSRVGIKSFPGENHKNTGSPACLQNVVAKVFKTLVNPQLNQVAR